MKTITKQNALPSDARIVVVGAGPAGLYAAAILRARGFANVMILEASDRVGGQCRTVTVEGVPVDLGAHVMGSEAGSLLSSIAHDIPVRRIPRHRFIHAGERVLPFDARFRKAALSVFPCRRMPETIRVLALRTAVRHFSIARHRSGFVPTVQDINLDWDELSIPFSMWLKRRGLGYAMGFFEFMHSQLGLGDIRSNPAGWVLKLLTPELVKGTARQLIAAARSEQIMSPLLSFVDGFGDFWINFAAGLDIRFNQEVSKIQRNEDETLRISLSPSLRTPTVTENATYSDEIEEFFLPSPSPPLPTEFEVTCDAVVLACNPIATAKIVWGIPQLRHLMKMFMDAVSDPICSVVVSLEGIPSNTIHILNKNRGPTDPFMLSAHPERRDLFVMRLRGNTSVRATVHEFVHALGGRVRNIHRIEQHPIWYRPKASDLADDFYRLVDAYQGHAGLFYFGEFVGGPSIDETIIHTTNVITRHFPAYFVGASARGRRFQFRMVMGA